MVLIYTERTLDGIGKWPEARLSLDKMAGHVELNRASNKAPGTETNEGQNRKAFDGSERVISNLD